LTKTYTRTIKIEIGQDNQVECELCGKELEHEETVYRVLGTNRKDFKLKIHYYCQRCGEELVSGYKKKSEWIIEN